ncbi:MAG: hypothetical protein AB8B51_13590 [Sedimentitalea sp.]
MNSSDFDDFARAFSKSDDATVAPEVVITRVAIMGGGKDARCLAALCLAQGLEVVLFSAYSAELDVLRKAQAIPLRGAGPIGSFHVDQKAGPSIQTTSAIDTAVMDADAVFLTGPVHKQRTYAMVLADHLCDGQIVVLPNARSFAAVEAAWLLRTGGCLADLTLVDMVGLSYWIDESPSALTLSEVSSVPVATLPDRRPAVIAALQAFLPGLEPTHSALHSGFVDASAAVECPALILGGSAISPGGPHVPDGAVPLAQNNSFRNLIGPDHIALIDVLWSERCRVAACFGVREMPKTDAILTRVAGEANGAGARPVPAQSEARALLRCGAIGSLAPLASAARIAGIDVPMTHAMLAQISAIVDGDLKSAGRRLDSIGVTANNLDEARSHINQIVKRVRHGQ